MTKIEKANLINKALQRSEVAIQKQAEAVILDDGRIEYRMLSGNGRYTMKASFREMLGLMWGTDMRNLKQQLGR